MSSSIKYEVLKDDSQLMISASSAGIQSKQLKETTSHSLKEPLLGFGMDEIYEEPVHPVSLHKDKSTGEIISLSPSTSRRQSKLRSSDNSSVVSNLPTRVYANNAPKIFLETITAFT